MSTPLKAHLRRAARGGAICAIIVLLGQIVLFALIFNLRHHSDGEPAYLGSPIRLALQLWPLTLCAIGAGIFAGGLNSVANEKLPFSAVVAFVLLPPALVYFLMLEQKGFAPNVHTFAMIGTGLGAGVAMMVSLRIRSLCGNSHGCNDDMAGTSPENDAGR